MTALYCIVYRYYDVCQRIHRDSGETKV